MSAQLTRDAVPAAVTAGFPVGGVVEDPATGAAAAAFGGYPRALGLLPASGVVTVRQGEDMGRPSDLTVRADPDDERVSVTGRAVPIGDGRAVPTGEGHGS